VTGVKSADAVDYKLIRGAAVALDDFDLSVRLGL
jgi:hypothetical protein